MILNHILETRVNTHRNGITGSAAGGSRTMPWSKEFDPSVTGTSAEDAGVAAISVEDADG